MTPRHRVLHVTRVHDRVYLEDADRHLYEAGRDTQGHVYPVYRDPVTRASYPLYYDPARDNLYRVARNDDGRFYRNYVGQPSRQFYAADRDYERFPSSDDDRPVVTDSYNTYNYNTYNTYGNGSSPYEPSRPYGNPRPFYGAYRPAPVHHSSHHNSDWLWAIPVIIGAYFLLQPHPRHSSPPYRAAPPTVIVRQTTPVTIINNNAPVYNGRPSYTAVYAPPPPLRTRPLSPRALAAVHRLPPPSAYTAPVARPIRPLPPRVVAYRHPIMPTLAPIRPRPVFRPRQIAVRPPRPAFFRRPRFVLARHVRVVNAALVPHPAPKPMAHAPEAPRAVVFPARPRPKPAEVRLVRPRVDVHSDAPKPVTQPVHPVELHPRIETRTEVRHETPRAEPAASNRPAPPSNHVAEPLRRETIKSRREEVEPVRPKTDRPREERKKAEKKTPTKHEEKRKDTRKPANHSGAAGRSPQLP